MPTQTTQKSATVPAQTKKKVRAAPCVEQANDNEPRRSNGQRIRKPTEREIARREEEEELATHKAARTLLAQKRARQAQREADIDAGNDVSDESDTDHQAVRYSFSSQLVTTRHDKQAAQLAARVSKVPPPSSLEDFAEEESDIEQAHDDITRTPSPIPGEKRTRSPSDAGDFRDSTTEKVRKITNNTGRPKAGDYDELTRDVLVPAISIFRCLISSECAYPDHAQEREFVQRAWSEGCRLAGVSEFPITPSIAKLLAARASHLRGEMKTKARPVVKGGYGFENGQDKKTIKANRTLAEDLKERIGFAYKTIYDDEKQLLDCRKGLYRNKNIQTLINDMFFANRRDEGVVFSEYFNPIRVPCLALILTSLECAVDEWATGIKTDINFLAADYKSIYEGHIKCLKEFSEHTRAHNLLPRILTTLHDNGRFHSGAQPLTKEEGLMLDIQDFRDAVAEAEVDTETDDDTDSESGGS